MVTQFLWKKLNCQRSNKDIFFPSQRWVLTQLSWHMQCYLFQLQVYWNKPKGWDLALTGKILLPVIFSLNPETSGNFSDPIKQEKKAIIYIASTVVFHTHFSFCSSLRLTDSKCLEDTTYTYRIWHNGRKSLGWTRHITSKNCETLKYYWYSMPG